MAAGDVRQRARHELEQLGLSVESAAYLVDDRPPGGWDSLVTLDDLRVETSSLRVEMAALRAEIHSEIREQTRWFATIVIGAMSVSIAASAVMGAALRFA